MVMEREKGGKERERDRKERNIKKWYVRLARKDRKREGGSGL